MQDRYMGEGSASEIELVGPQEESMEVSLCCKGDQLDLVTNSHLLGAAYWDASGPGSPSDGSDIGLSGTSFNASNTTANLSRPDCNSGPMASAQADRYRSRRGSAST